MSTVLELLNAKVSFLRQAIIWLQVTNDLNYLQTIIASNDYFTANILYTTIWFQATIPAGIQIGCISGRMIISLCWLSQQVELKGVNLKWFHKEEKGDDKKIA